MKRKAYKFLIITAAMALGLVGCSTEAKVERQLELGASSMEAGDYDAAITAYEEAIALDKYEIEGYEGLVVAMVADERSSEEIVGVVAGASDVIAELKTSEEGLSEEDKAAAEKFYTTASDAVAGDMDMEIAIMEEGVGVLGEESQIADAYKEKLETAIEEKINANDFEFVLDHVETLETLLPGDADMQEMATNAAEEAEKLKEIAHIMLDAYNYVLGGPPQALANLNRSEDMDILKEFMGENSHYVYMLDGGTSGIGVGVYFKEGWENDPVWYVGEYVDGMRHGEGEWEFTKYNESEILYREEYRGEWANDMPNGRGTHYVERGGEVTKDWYVDVKDGLYHGTHMISYTDEDAGITVDYITFEVNEGIPVAVEEIDPAITIDEGCYVYWIRYYNDQTGSMNIDVNKVAWGQIKQGTKLGVAHYR